MKKILSILIAASLCIALFAGCGESGGSSSKAESTAKSEAPAAETKTETKSEVPAAETKSEAPAAETKTETKSEAPATETKSEAPATETKSEEPKAEATEPPVEIELSVALTNPENSPLGQMIVALQDKTNELLGGDYLTLTMYPSGTLSGDPEMLDSIESGLADMGIVHIQYQMDRFPICEVTEQLAAIIPSGMAATAAMSEFFRTYEPAKAEMGTNTMLLCCTGGYGAIYANKPIYTLDDVKNLKIRSQPNQNDMVLEWGAVPTTIAFTEAYEAMRNNLVDAVLGDGGAGAIFNFQDVANTYVYFPLSGSASLVLISDAAMQKLPDSMQEALLEASEIVQQEFCVEYFPTLGSLKPLFERFFAGIDECIFLSEDTLNEMLATAKPSVDAYIASLDEKGYNGQEALDTYLALLEKYGKDYPVEDVINEFKEYCANVTVCE